MVVVDRGARTPEAVYRRELREGTLEADPAQARVVEALQGLYEALPAPVAPARGWLAGLRERLAGRRRAPVRGLYLWGGVGSGKTHLVNVFHCCLPIENKLRIHFHSFMQRVHDELRRLGEVADPLDHVARGLAHDARVISFDEFHVSDIGDAMLLGRLLEKLFERGVTLVATSNTAPDDLYRDGLQRARFLRAIELIKAHTRVMEVTAATDYRLRALEQAEIYHCPLDDTAHESLLRCFQSLGPEHVLEHRDLDVLGRPVRARYLADGIAWFDFAALCETPRSSADYIEIARRYHTLLLSDVPVMDDRDRDRVLRFIHLVDELYDRRVNLAMSADAAPDALYAGQRLASQFQRTRSRLVEMRSREYLARGHVP